MWGEIGLFVGRAASFCLADIISRCRCTVEGIIIAGARNGVPVTNDLANDEMILISPKIFALHSHAGQCIACNLSLLLSIVGASVAHNAANFILTGNNRIDHCAVRDIAVIVARNRTGVFTASNRAILHGNTGNRRIRSAGNNSRTVAAGSKDIDIFQRHITDVHTSTKEARILKRGGQTHKDRGVASAAVMPMGM